MKSFNKIVKDFLKEHIESMAQFYLENNIDPNDLSYLGKGEFGVAYSIGDGRVLKLTRSKKEFEIAQELEKTNLKLLIKSFAKVYKTDIVDGQMLIILEELEEDSNIENLFYKLYSYLEEQGLHITYIHNLDKDEIEISDELTDFISDLEDIVLAYHHLGIIAPDISPENLGYSKEGILKAFDIDDKNK